MQLCFCCCATFALSCYSVQLCLPAALPDFSAMQSCSTATPCIHCPAQQFDHAAGPCIYCANVPMHILCHILCQCIYCANTYIVLLHCCAMLHCVMLDSTQLQCHAGLPWRYAKYTHYLITLSGHADTPCLQAKTITKATLTHRQWHLNYYHSIAESAFEVYNLACTYFQLCNLHTRGDFVPIFLDKPGIAGWDTRLGVTEGGWDTVLPPVAEALQCFYPKPALWVADPRLHKQVCVNTDLSQLCVPAFLMGSCQTVERSAAA